MTVNIHFSDFFEVAPETLEQYGAFNISLVNDLPLFVDPFLLFNSTKPEYQQLHSEIIRYVRFLREMSAQPGIRLGLLRSWFYFSEVRQNWLGYSMVGNYGSGLGKDFANALNQNLYTVFTNFGDEEVTRSSHLEKLCLVKDGVGKDNISDFTTNLIKAFLLEYTQSFAIEYVNPELRRRVTVDRVRFNYETRSWERGIFDLPYFANDYVILTPKDILTKDDTWINKTDLIRDFDDIVAALPNEQLRAQINAFLLQSIPEKPKKKDIEEVIIQAINNHPEIIDYYIRYKEDNGERAKNVSQQKVSETENLYIRNIKELVEKLIGETNFYQSHTNTYDETYDRVMYLKDVIENKDGYKVFYDGDVPIRREVDLQLFFRLTWFATPSDVNREVNNGRGPVDYKVSRGSKDATLVEFKLASNSQLQRNLEKQVPIYEKASDATNPSIKIILYFTEAELRKVQGILTTLNLAENPNIVLIDARNDNKPSASKA
ncbi:MAG: hypothetical protein JOZ51_24875 [Chloroflexi bacterium]|nr:hypothetical protein [Chloroflexota bacterium]